MTDFERELREAMARIEPPEGFADRVMARVRADRKKVAMIGRRRWLPLALAASLLLAAGIPVAQRIYKQRQAEKAAEQLVLALDITQEKLAFTRRHVEALQQRTIP